MSSQDDEPEFRVAAFVLIAAVILAVGLALGVGIHKSRSGAAAASGAPTATAVVSTTTTVLGADDASVVVENGVVRFYFATGKSDLASGALDALADAIKAAQGGKKLVISGFHDATGDPAFNAELAKQRAFVVRDALVGAGVAEAVLELRKPEQTTGSGNNAEARRVEVVIAP
ncbi:OmpA family protein [Hydrogenophaga sp.]|uniref:OmpA family protein n=1 Tax=Hydrogenophaga sp. TaxID=1904254 RepID=UPI00263969F9|nr:OmpA family protein [Hydrogenophaga sp.]MCW5655700.1 OmpA family protein [Hydrogenophaga sp.]